MQEQSGIAVHYPKVEVRWNPENQTVAIAFDPHEFKTWDFILAVLEMAKVKAEESKRLNQLNQMRAQMAEQQQANALAQQIAKQKIQLG